MKKRVIIVVCVAVAVVLVAGVALTTLPYFKNRLYLGDRFTGAFSMTVSGIPYVPTDATVEYENQGTQRLATDGAGQFRIKGGSYGNYQIGFILDNNKLYELTNHPLFKAYSLSPTLTFRYMNVNWWHVTEMILTANMSLSDGHWTLDCQAVYKESTENGGFAEDTVEKSFTYDEVISGNGVIRFGM